MEEQTKKRLIELESSLGLLQHDFEAQNEMILLNTRLLHKLERAIARIVSEVEELKTDDEPRKAEDEVPPHY